MKVLFVNQYYDPEPAATGQLLKELCEDLSKTDEIEITVLTGFPSYHDNIQYQAKNLLKREQLNGVEVIRSYNTSLRRENLLGRFANYLTFTISSLFSGLITTNKPDIVVAMTDPPIIGIVAYIISKLKRASFVYISQDVFPEIFSALGILDNKFTKWVLGKVSTFLLRKADRVIAIGYTMKETLLQKGADSDKTIVIENWADPSLITPEDKANPFSIKHQLNNKFVVMYSGNIGANQNLETLIEAASILKNINEIVFVIIGEGIAKKKLKKKVSTLGLDNVIFLPYQPKENLKYSLSSADLSVICQTPGLSGYVVASKIYGILASGRPVVAAIEEKSDIARLVKEENCGMIIEPGNAKKMAETIEYLFENKTLLQEYGRNSRRAAEKKYSREVAVSKYRELFEELYSSTDFCSET